MPFDATHDHPKHGERRTLSISANVTERSRAVRLSARSGVGSPRGSLPEAPLDPDVRNCRIRRFGARLCYVTGTKRIRACGSG